MSGGRSVSYNASLEKLTFANDVMTDTGFAGDPVVGANVNVPDLMLVGALGDGNFIFDAGANALFTIEDGVNLFLQAQLPFLTYLVADNLFFGELTDFSFSSLGSPWIAAMADLFNPASANFDPNRKLWFEYMPQDNMLSLTQFFTQNGASGGTNGIFAANAIPEPSTLTLFILGLESLLLICWCNKVASRRE